MNAKEFYTEYFGVKSPNEKGTTINESVFNFAEAYKSATQQEQTSLLDSISSCYALFDEEDNIVQLYQTEDKANKGMEEFKRSHEHANFYVDKMQIN